MDIREELQKAFSESGLSLSDASYGQVWQQIYQSGSHYQEQFKQISGKRLWNRVMHSDDIKIGEQNHIRISGFGAAITEYMILPLNLPESERTAVIRLGTLANFIVTFFDYCLDTHNHTEVLLPQPSKLIGSRMSKLDFFFRSLVNPKVKFLNRLVKHYLQSIDYLPFADHRRETVNLLHRAIKTMYKAELQTVTADGSKISLRVIRRKSALPFVVMALPAWLSIEKPDKSAFMRYLSWSYHFGYFFCLLDDAVDLADDIRHNRPNYFLFDGKWMKSPESIVERVVDYGIRVSDNWNKRTDLINSSTNLVFPALIRSWIGKG